MKKMILIAFALTAALSFGQSPQQPQPPVQVLETKVAFWWSDGQPKQYRVQVLNNSNKDIAICEYKVTYYDKLDRITGGGHTEPATCHESGHPILRPGKKGANYYDWDITQSGHSRIVVEPLTVKFTDGTLWEAPKQ
jgi:hypothetical protein